MSNTGSASASGNGNADSIDIKKKPSNALKQNLSTAGASAACPPILGDDDRKHHSHEVMIYYEDTDFTGVVYHPNYLKYFERAREHLLGPHVLVDLYNKYGYGFVVYSCEMNFKEGAKHGDILDIRTVTELSGQYRLKFDQHVFRKSPNPVDVPLVKGRVEMVCVDKQNKLVPIPQIVLDELNARYSS